MHVNLNTFSPAAFNRSASHQVPAIDLSSRVAIIGAGSFGGWTALSLLRAGYKVTLFDAWGPGNSRSSSGDETRVIRSTYGANEFYFDLNVRALELWKENELRLEKKLFYNTGVLWLCHHEATPIVDDSLPFARKHNMPYERLTQTELSKRYPVIDASVLSHAYYDPYGGYLKARDGTLAVCDAFINEGGDYVRTHISPGEISHDELKNIKSCDGDKHIADIYIFACGSWLSSLFPERLQQAITCSKQEVYYFGTPASQTNLFENLPVWIDADGRDFYYGIPNNAGRGFKIGVDRRGELFNPSYSERNINPDTLDHARNFMRERFPALKNAPLLENRVCPYENSVDGNFVFDTIPGITNTYILGGGSGHGFKHGPALGELITRLFQGKLKYPEILKLKR